MLFKFLEKKITLDCFTSDQSAIEYSPINFAIKHIPEWWKDLPKPFFDEQKKTTFNTNMKHCVGMVDYYKKSVAIPLWCDLVFETNNNYDFTWQFSNNRSNIGQHDTKIQATGFLENYAHIKIISPWFFKSEKNINWVWSHPTYNYKNSSDFACLPGITNFYYQNTTNINMMLNINSRKQILIPQGQPLALLTPMSDRKIEIVRHLVSYEEMQKIGNKHIRITFEKNYNNVIKRKEQFINCPYEKLLNN